MSITLGLDRRLCKRNLFVMSSRNRTILSAPAHPSITALRAFLAVAATGSTQRAAAIVHLTQSAVSKQIRSLEQLLGAALFARGPQGLRLTAEGDLYLPFAQAAIEQIERGTVCVRQRAGARPPIRLHMLAIVGERWLIDRFPAFAAAHPGIDVQFTNYVSENRAESPDIDIRFGAGPWPDVESHYLFGREVALVANRDLAARHGGFADVSEVQQTTLLQHFQMTSVWAEFTEAHGVRGAVPAHTVRYGYLSVIIRAAIAGLGIALVPRVFIGEELASGSLVNPNRLGVTSASGCWLAVRPDSAARREVRLLVDWLLAAPSPTMGEPTA